jgi:transcriptional regulator with GAF, ATPase, and Fis domain
MDPLNKKERTEAFIKMLLLFLLTVVIMAIPMYYAFQMPQKDMALSNKEYEELKALIKSNNQNDKDFVVLADSAHSLFVQYSKESIEVKKGRISDRFSTVLNNMEDAALHVVKDSVRSDLYRHIIEAYSNLIVKNDDISALKAELKKTTEKAEGGEGGGSDKKISGDPQIQLIKSTLAKHNGNKKDAAKELGMTERRLKKRMDELGM